MTDKLHKIRARVEKLKSNLMRGACASQIVMETYCKEEAYNEVLAILDTMQKEIVSKELEEVADDYALDDYIKPWRELVKRAFKDGANWQKETLWKSANGNDLPEIDREVIALLDNGKVVFAHRPSEYWDGKDIITGKVTRNYPKIYDKGGWNIPDVKWWLDCSIPNLEEV